MTSPYPPSYRSEYATPYDRTSPSSFQPVQPYEPSQSQSQQGQSQRQGLSPSRSPANGAQYDPRLYNTPYAGPGAESSMDVSRPEDLSPEDDDLDEDSASLIDFKKMMSWRFWLRKEWIPWYLIVIVLVVSTILMTVFHTQIVNWMKPAATWMRDLPAGWLIPVAILFVISFPPLFGHEIVAILCGVVWGLWIGFAIVALGTFLGEVGNFYAFKYLCHSRSEKHEKSTPWYACMARVVREGGFKIAFITRLSAIPGHFTTAIFATCGMNIWIFCLAAALSLPKQFVTVYLGYLLEESGSGVQQPESSKIISDVIVAISVLITIFAAWYIWHKMQQVKPQVMREMRRAKRLAGRGREQTFSAYKAGEERGGSQENLWNSEFNASDMTLTDPSKNDKSNASVTVKPYNNPYLSSPGDSLFRPMSSNTDLPPGAAAPVSVSVNPYSQSQSQPGRATPLAASGKYAPPSQTYFQNRQQDDLVGMEPLSPAPGTLDQGYYSAPQTQSQSQYLAPTSAQTHSQMVDNPFEDHHAYTPPPPPPLPAGPTQAGAGAGAGAGGGKGKGIVVPQPQYAQAQTPPVLAIPPPPPAPAPLPQGPDAPFPVMTNRGPGSGGARRGVQLRDG
ncbi:hypothetical protein DACRYDRAFT_62746 [Dacryopinax primogenitus]|uniref:Golgi apparatus membrane protein TVP38 n=1 Tax=Dacryopinax primogenitus (strain DJM 731) TaxID=1858805 RepID=M5G2Y4_DACPD|nr:uncharacterized protein DACRYDRAFT_62746 [Dacryopinax primogenitus]EJU04591.1 hypothetical protein DACRYDRAFT_62746 [Dacryopinax primogenitus]